MIVAGKRLLASGCSREDYEIRSGPDLRIWAKSPTFGT